MKKIIRNIVALSLCALIFNIIPVKGVEDLSVKLSGYILLQVESNGEAWYVSPVNQMRYYLGRPDDAFFVIRSQGKGISNSDLKKIPVGIVGNYGVDQDGDGLSDQLESALGTNTKNSDSDGDGFSDKEEILNAFNPVGPGTQPIEMNFVNKHMGEIFLQVEAHGEAWYLNPRDKKRYFLGHPVDAFAIMRELGLGISSENLATIVALAPGYDLRQIEHLVHELVNKEREAGGINPLAFNDELTNVAREHSFNLAKENQSFTGMGYACDFPIIHHEGLNFGLYNSSRLNNRGIYYFGQSGENIASIPAPSVTISFSSRSEFEKNNTECQSARDKLEKEFRGTLEEAESDTEKIEFIQKELAYRKKLFEKEPLIEIVGIEWDSPETIAQKTVAGWMNSPGHRANIMESEYNEAGMGAAYVSGYFIITQNFIRRVECGYRGGECCVKTGYYPYCYVGLECSDGGCE